MFSGKRECEYLVAEGVEEIEFSCLRVFEPVGGSK
jgi:hypothetical protein